MESLVTFAPTWVDSALFEEALTAAIVEPHSSQTYTVRFVMPTGCALMVDAGARLLSVSNQLSRCTKRVILDFEAGLLGTMGYLNRMGFFDTLDQQVEVLPARPAISGALVHGGGNRNLVEFKALNPKTVDKELPGRLADSLKNSLPSRMTNGNQLGDAAFTIFSELIQNVYRHSETKFDGYAALQLYRGGKRKVQVSVSDSGLGIMKTLRPSLKRYFPALANKSDPDLLIEMVSKGVSRFGPDNGCGIHLCARKALSLNASMEIRMPNSRVVFMPSSDRRYLGIVSHAEGLPLIWGTHICLNFQLD
jgi:hypothetical protein